MAEILHVDFDITNSMERVSSSEFNSSSASQEISHILRKPKTHYLL